MAETEPQEAEVEAEAADQAVARSFSIILSPRIAAPSP
jgi:hypothetical protein